MAESLFHWEYECQALLFHLEYDASCQVRRRPTLRAAPMQMDAKAFRLSVRKVPKCLRAQPFLARGLFLREPVLGHEPGDSDKARIERLDQRLRGGVILFGLHR